MTANPASFHTLLGRLAANGGELLRRLAVEHEKEVSHLHSEIARLQETIAHFTGAAPPDVKAYEVDKKVSRGSAVSSLPNSGKEQSRERQGRKAAGDNSRGAGKPDENALAKAFAFVDAIHDDRGLLHSIEQEGEDATLEIEDTSSVLRIAAEIADFTRQTQDGKGQPLRSTMAGGGVFARAPPTAPPGPGGPPLEPPVRPLLVPEASRPQGMGEFRLPNDCRGELVNVRPLTPDTPGLADFVATAPDIRGAPGIKLSTISPPVQALGRMSEPLPELDDGDEVHHVPLQSEVLNERFELHLPRRLPVAADINIAESLARESSDRPQAASSRSPEGDGHGGDVDLPSDSGLKSVPMFLKSGLSKPENETLLSALDGRFQGSSESPMPSRETTTWQAPFEESDIQRYYNSPVEPDSPSTPASEAVRASGSADVLAEDWRSLLQAQGSKWRPTGDDGVGIMMYMDQPREPGKGLHFGSTCDKKAPSIEGPIAPTSI